MGVIESLKAKVEENGYSVELSDDANGAEEDCDETVAGMDEETVDDGVCFQKNDEDEENLGKKLDDSLGGFDVSELQLGELEVDNEVPDPMTKCNTKRKRANAKELLPKRRDGKRARKDRKAEDKGNNSPSSSLPLLSDHDREF